MAVSEGSAPSETPGATAEDAAGVRPLDFSAPTRFTAELRHHVAHAMAPFGEALAAWLTTELGEDTELTVADSAQDTWAAARSRLSVDSVAVAVNERESGRQLMLSVELALVLQAVECLLGGQAAQAPSERRLTDIDWALVRGLLDGVVRELSHAWVELGGQELACGEIDIEGDAGVAPAADEPTLIVAVTGTIGKAGPSAMSLLIPWGAFEPAAESAAEALSHGEQLDEHGSDALRRGLSSANVLVRAEVGSAQMPIERMLEIVPGKLVALAEPAQDGVRLFAEEVTIGHGTPGRSGTRRAIKVRTAAEQPTRAETYATLGRAELDRARSHAEGAAGGEGRPILRNIFVRVWAELGRTHIPLGRALELAPGAVVELDQDASAPVELFANGLCFASGSLVVTGDGEWGVQVDRLT